MDFLELTKARYSVRGFDDRAVEEEKLQKILDAALCAPSACNIQPIKLIVMKTEEAIEKLKLSKDNVWDAKLAIMVCYDKNQCWTRGDGYSSGDTDAAIVGTHIILAAADLGLGSTWVGSFDDKIFAKAFDLPENIVPAALFPIGYPKAEPSPLHTERKTIEEVVEYK